MLGGVPWRDCDLEMWPFVERVWRKKPFAGSPQALTVPATVDCTALPLWSSFILLLHHKAGLYLQNYTLRPIFSLFILKTLSFFISSLTDKYFTPYLTSHCKKKFLISGAIISFFPFLASYHPRPPVPPSHTDRCHVNGRCGLVHDENAALPHKGSGQTEELPLTLAEVFSSFCHHGIWRG